VTQKKRGVREIWLPWSFWRGSGKRICLPDDTHAWPSCSFHPLELFLYRKRGFSSFQRGNRFWSYRSRGLFQWLSNNQPLWPGWCVSQLGTSGHEGCRSTIPSHPSLLSLPWKHNKMRKENHMILLLHILTWKEQDIMRVVLTRYQEAPMARTCWGRLQLWLGQWRSCLEPSWGGSMWWVPHQWGGSGSQEVNVVHCCCRGEGGGDCSSHYP